MTKRTRPLASLGELLDSEKHRRKTAARGFSNRWKAYFSTTANNSAFEEIAASIKTAMNRRSRL
jgi:hypothetical protein